MDPPLQGGPSRDARDPDNERVEPRDGAPHELRARRRPRMTRRVPAPRTVLAISSLGVFMVFLDTTIVNIAFPDIRAVQRRRPRRAVVGDQRLQHRVGGILRRVRALRGRPRAQAALRRRRRAVRRRLRACAGGAVGRYARRGARRAGAGAAILVPAGLALVVRAFPAGEQGARDRPVERGGRAGRRHRAVGRRRARRSLRLAAGVPRQRAGRHRRRARSPHARGKPGAGRRRAARPARLRGAGARIGAVTLGIVKGGEWGWTSGAVLSSSVVGIAPAPCSFAAAAPPLAGRRPRPAARATSRSPTG